MIRNGYLSGLVRRFCSPAGFLFVLIFVFPLFAAAQDEASDDAVAVFNQAQDLHEKGDLKGAVQLYEKALQIEPQFPEAEYQRAIAELALGQTAEAEKAFRRALALREDWTLAMTGLGSLLVREGQTGEADKLLSKVIELEPQNFNALAALADSRLKTNAPPAALRDLLAKISALTAKANPTASLWSARAALERGLGMRDAAKASIVNALNVDPKHTPALYLAGDIAVEEGDVVKANDVVRTLEGVSPNAEPLTILKAKISASDGDPERALKLLDTVPPSSVDAIALRAQITARTATPADLEKRLAADPRNTEVLGRLCSLLRRNDPQKAVGYCRQAVEAEPGNVNQAIAFAAALVQAKKLDPAVSILRKAVELAPDNWTAHANLATALFELKRYKEAKPEYFWLSVKRPNLPAAQLLLAITFDQLGEYMDAMASYQNFLKIADATEDKLDIEKVNLRLPQLERQIKQGKGKK